MSPLPATIVPPPVQKINDEGRKIEDPRIHEAAILPPGREGMKMEDPGEIRELTAPTNRPIEDHELPAANQSEEPWTLPGSDPEVRLFQAASPRRRWGDAIRLQVSELCIDGSRSSDAPPWSRSDTGLPFFFKESVFC
jgi:hypothetical protein